MPYIQRCRSWVARHVPTLPEDPTHVTQVAIRTYGLALSLSLGPALIPFIAAFFSSKGSLKANSASFRRLLRRELGHDGFAFAITTSVAGGAVLRQFWSHLLDDSDSSRSPPSTKQSFANWLRSFNLTDVQMTFLSNICASSIGIVLLQAGRERSMTLRTRRKGPASQVSPTLDLTLLLLVRAMDSLLQSFIAGTLVSPIPLPRSKGLRAENGIEPRLVQARLEKEKLRQRNEERRRLTSIVDAFVFWICSARIMWCFFYDSQQLPRSYVKWISALANVDERVLEALRLLRTNQWSYISGSQNHLDLLRTYAEELGYPPAWGDPSQLPAYGGAVADKVWKQLGVPARRSVGGLPCEIVHGRVGQSQGLSANCHANVTLRSLKAFTQALAIYLPVHFVPTLLTRPRTLLRPKHIFNTVLASLRSTSFLTSFIALYWYTVCFCRSVALAKLLPSISHQFWDGPYGAVMAGSLACGASIWVENGRRRGEMALYVLPRALRTCLPRTLLNNRGWFARLIERAVFASSMSFLLTASIHRPDSLRGLSRWTLAFVMNGPNAGFWKRKRQDPSVPSTPDVAPTPPAPEGKGCY